MQLVGTPGEHALHLTDRQRADAAAPAGPATDATNLLTKRLAAGDEEAFREFRDGYFDRLQQFVLVLTRGDEHEAQDALQETLIRVARYVRPLSTEEVFWSWLKMVARSATRDRHRKRRRYLALLEGFAWRWRGIVTDPTDTSELHARLDEALAELGSEDRRLLERKYVAGSTVKDLASETGIGEKALESRLLRLRRHVRERLLNCIQAR